MNDVRCPKCRALGLSTDCADRLLHGTEDQHVIHNDEEYELEVTLTFAVPLNSSIVMSPHEAATHMRETWMNDDSRLKTVLSDAVEEDYDLQVRPVFTA